MMRKQILLPCEFLIRMQHNQFRCFTSKTYLTSYNLQPFINPFTCVSNSSCNEPYKICIDMLFNFNFCSFFELLHTMRGSSLLSTLIKSFWIEGCDLRKSCWVEKWKNKININVCNNNKKICNLFTYLN